MRVIANDLPDSRLTVGRSKLAQINGWDLNIQLGREMLQIALSTKRRAQRVVPGKNLLQCLL